MTLGVEISKRFSFRGRRSLIIESDGFLLVSFAGFEKSL
jgi:hypothetical protein